MLDSPSEDRAPQPTDRELICNLQLPAALEDDFERTGPVPSLPGESRRFPRAFWRGKRCVAALEYRQTLPGIPRLPAWHRVYTVDISKGGVCLLHSEQLFPGERMPLVFATGDSMLFEVVWCRRVEQRCFRVGGKFANREDRD